MTRSSTGARRGRRPSASAASSPTSPTATTCSTRWRAWASTARWRRALVRAARARRPSRACSTCAPAPATSRSRSPSRAGPPRSSPPTSRPRCSTIAERKAARLRRAARGSRSRLADAQDAAVRRRELRRGDRRASACATCPTAQRNFPRSCACSSPGGRYVILEFSTPAVRARGAASTTSTCAHVDPGDRRRAHRRPRRASSTSTTRSGGSRRRPQLAAELRDAGFSAITWRDLTGGIVALHTAVK